MHSIENRELSHFSTGQRNMVVQSKECGNVPDCEEDKEEDPSALWPILTHPLPSTVSIQNSQNVHIGNVVYINDIKILESKPYDNHRILRETKPQFPMVKRMGWLAEPCRGPKEYLEKPAKFVIINHTATEESFTQAENTLTVRLAQTFHIDSRGWDDIAYNFLIGSDGNVYEGRGWNIVGAHTLGYNTSSVGIAFVGCFLSHLPPQNSMERCKELIAFGIRIGAIQENYQLLAHCQCRPSLSPGKRLFEEIKTWKNWNADVSLSNPN